jgi:hypothetical protein
METPTRRLRIKYPSWQDHVATGVLLVLGNNNHLDLLENAAEQATRAPLDYTGQTRPCWSNLANLRASTEGSYTGQACVACRSDRSKLGNPKSTKQTYRAPKLTKLETAATRDNRKLTKTFTRAKPNQGSTPVRPVRGTGQIGQDLSSQDE